MDPKNLLQFLRRLESLKLEYMVTGSVASILYGKPRLTQDMDVVIIFPLMKISEFIRLFPLEEYYCPPPEAIKEAVLLGNIGHLNIIDQQTGFKIDLYPIRDDALGLWGLQSKKRVELLQDEEVWVAPPEYVILKKMLYYQEGKSEKHLEDIRGMLEVTAEQINMSVLQSWIEKLHLEEIWKLVKR